jgi:hypothetical protein
MRGHLGPGGLSFSLLSQVSISLGLDHQTYFFTHFIFTISFLAVLFKLAVLAVQLSSSSGALPTSSFVDTRRTSSWSKAHASSAGHLALRGTVFSLPAGAVLSSSRLVPARPAVDRSISRMLLVLQPPGCLLTSRPREWLSELPLCRYCHAALLRYLPRWERK